MATKIQNGWRCRGARQAANSRRHVKLEHKSATMIQTLWRARQGGLYVRAKRQRIKNATDIQRCCRGHLGRKRFADIKEQADRVAATQTLQRGVRGMLARKKVRAMKQEIQVRMHSSLETTGTLLFPSRQLYECTRAYP